ncbi:AAA family ATPase [Pararhodonellum marinum]|uniref:AAA family ATPase n=1 Tax=Pararhodonellum marinum TaxID=2755358 RepID=UPI00188DD2EA|nr:ATP-binding protein [Pararhodonellum marinum]
MPIKKIVILGPESTGKSTLTQSLASHFKEPWVREYAREYLDRLAGPYQYEDLLIIAQGQLAQEDQMVKLSKEFLFCDTDLHVIDIWSQHKYGKTEPWIKKNLQQRHYDYYLLTDIDVPWQEDPQREHPEPIMRNYFLQEYKKLLEFYNRPYSLISGSGKQRLKLAIQVISKHFNVPENRF